MLRCASRSLHLRRRPRSGRRSRPTTCIASASTGARAASSCSVPGAASACVGAIGCERDRRRKVRHIGHIVGMMVAAGGARPRRRPRLLQRPDRRVPADRRLEMLTLTVTAGNAGGRAPLRDAAASSSTATCAARSASTAAGTTTSCTWCWRSERRTAPDSDDRLPRRQPLPGLDHRVRVQRDRDDALVGQPVGEVGMVARPLAADADVLAGARGRRRWRARSSP